MNAQITNETRLAIVAILKRELNARRQVKDKTGAMLVEQFIMNMEMMDTLVLEYSPRKGTQPWDNK